MSMFDEYIPNPSIACPRCGKELVNWQGKDGPNLLLVWKQGERYPIDCKMSDEFCGGRKQDFMHDIRNRLPEQFEIYTDSCACKRFVYAIGTCHDGLWNSTLLQSRENAVPYSHESDCEFRKRIEALEQNKP